MSETARERAERLAAEKYSLAMDPTIGYVVQGRRDGFVDGYLARDAETRTPTVDEVAAVLHAESAEPMWSCVVIARAVLALFGGAA